MLAKTKLTILIATQFWLIQAPGSAQASCRAENIPIAMGATTDIASEGLVVTSEANTAVAVRATNRGSAPIRGLLLVMELLSEPGTPLHSIPFIATSADDSVGLPIRVSVRHKVLWAHPLEPGSSASLQSEVASTSLGCPSSARVRAVALVYSDGSIFKWEDTDWVVAPDVVDAPRYFEARVNAYSEIWVTATIEASGKVSHLEQDIVAGGELPIESHFRAWVFSPAVRNGVAARSEIRLRIRTLAEDEGQSAHVISAEDPRLRTSFIAVDLIPTEREAARWVVYFGGRRASTILPGKLP